MPETAPLSVVVIVRNEEKNIEACLQSVRGWTGEIFIVDSFSDDRTLEIAREFTAKIHQHVFEGHAKQRNWALDNLPFSYEWILALDADHRVTAELRAEIIRVLENPPPGVTGFFMKRRQIFRGAWIRHGGYYPKYLLKLFKRGRARLDNVEFDYRFYVEGDVMKLKEDLIEENLNEADISFWIEKHNRFATTQALEELERRSSGRGWFLQPTFWGHPDQRVLWLKSIWYRLPLYLRPFLYFSYRYFVRLGFLDGKQGLIFHFLQGLWYRFLVDVKIEELKQQRRLT